MPERLERRARAKPRMAPPQAAPATEPLAALETVEGHLRRNELDPAVAALLPALDKRAEAGDQACGLAARLLRARQERVPAPTDALSATVDRLVRLVQLQEEQIRALRSLLEETL